ncbi:MAG: ATP-binding protein [Elusimicrobia bacterium]|nr:ATP-binding protein [Elusimicrobiota bacterium]
MRAAPPRAHGKAPPRRAAEKYGSKRLGALYEISKLLTRFIGTLEQIVLALLTVVTREFPLRSVVLIEKTSSKPRAVVWRAPGTRRAELRTAEARALKAFNYLTRSDVPASAAVEVNAPAFERTGGEGSPPARQGNFLTCPLIISGHPAFGALHLEGVRPFDEEDVRFVSAIADQLAIALDLYHARLDEVALRRLAEESKRHAEEETASRKRVEEEVRRLNEELERRVEERTLQFKDTIKELDAFTYSLAHDLRAPLRHIHGYSQLLVDGADAGSLKTYAHRIMAASQGMDSLINDLLAYSRLTLEKVKREPVSLDEVIKRVKAELADDLKERRARLDIEEPLPAVIGNATMLNQAITNLITNALKFAAPGMEPRILVKAERRDGRVRLWVEDNGIGIDPKHQERIFGVFQRLHKSEEYPGTGIGLAIVRRSMERLKGKAGVESEPGRGSRFWLELERAEAAP